MDLSDPSQLAIFTATVGLGSTLVGALIGFFGTSYATYQQILRQERDARRATYGEFLSNAAKVQGHQSERLSMAHEGHRLLAEVDTHHIDRDDPATVDRFEANARQLRERSDFLWSEKRRLQATSHEILTELTSQALRLKLIAPDMVFKAAYNVVDVMLMTHSGRTETPPKTNPRGNEGMSPYELVTEAMHTFQQLARADTQAAGAETWGTAAEKHGERVEFLRQELTRVLSGEPEHTLREDERARGAAGSDH